MNLPVAKSVRFAWLASVFWIVAGSSPGRGSEADAGRVLADAARFAQESCYRLIHHDTDEFTACLHDLLRKEGRTSLRRLGIEYFGWVGTLNSARMGMQGAEEQAHAFLRSFRATQSKLRIGDQTLCESVPGDCGTRLARMKLMEAEAQTRSRSGSRP